MLFKITGVIVFLLMAMIIIVGSLDNPVLEKTPEGRYKLTNEAGGVILLTLVLIWIGSALMKLW